MPHYFHNPMPSCINSFYLDILSFASITKTKYVVRNSSLPLIHNIYKNVQVIGLFLGGKNNQNIE